MSFGRPTDEPKVSSWFAAKAHFEAHFALVHFGLVGLNAKAHRFGLASVWSIFDKFLARVRSVETP